MNDKPQLNIPIIFQKLSHYDVEDTRFIKVKIWLMHLGENLNGSYFEKSVVEDAIPSLANTPILAYIEENSDGEKDFSDHRMILVKEEGQYKVKYIGQAIGVIPESNNAKFEFRLCDDGVEREFLTVEGLVWQDKWDDAPDILNRDLIKAESMELHKDYEGEFQEDNLFHFTKFKFYGACGLGKSVLPAMQNATIEVQFTFDGFQKEIQERMEQFKKFSLQNQSSTPDVDNINFSKKEDKKLDEKLELLKKYNLTLENISFKIEELSLEEIESKIKEQFSLTANQFREELEIELKVEQIEDDWGWKCSRYCYVDHKDNLVFAYDRADNWKLYGFEFTVNGDKVVINFESKKRKKFEIVDFEDGVSTEFELFPKDAIVYAVDVKEKELTKQFNSEKETVVNELQTKLDTITTEYEKIKPEYERLQKFESDILTAERKEAEDALFEEFKDLEGIQEYEEIKEKISEYELEDFSEKCFAIRGKKNSKFSVKQLPKKQDKVKIEFSKKNEEKVGEFDELFNKYLKKD